MPGSRDTTSALTRRGACRYFTDQAVLNESLHTVEAPTVEQLRQAFDCLRDTPAAPLADIEAASLSAGINAATLAHALRPGSVNTAREVVVVEPLLLLLTMRCSSLGAVLRGAFDVFGRAQQGGGGGGGGEQLHLDVPVLLQLLGILGARDPAVTAALREGVARAVEGRAAVTLAALAGVPAIAAKLAGA